MTQQFKAGLMAVLTLCSTLAFAAPVANKPAGKVVAVIGQVQAVHAGKTTTLKRRSPVYAHDLIRVADKPSAKVQLMMTDGTLLTLTSGTEVALRAYSYQSKKAKNAGTLDAEKLKGQFRFLTGQIAKKDPEKFKLSTPLTVIALRGTSGDSTTEAFGERTTCYQHRCCVIGKTASQTETCAEGGDLKNHMIYVNQSGQLFKGGLNLASTLNRGTTPGEAETRTTGTNDGTTGSTATQAPASENLIEPFNIAD